MKETIGAYIKLSGQQLRTAAVEYMEDAEDAQALKLANAIFNELTLRNDISVAPFVLKMVKMFVRDYQFDDVNELKQMIKILNVLRKQLNQILPPTEQI